MVKKGQNLVNVVKERPPYKACWTLSPRGQCQAIFWLRKWPCSCSDSSVNVNSMKFFFLLQNADHVFPHLAPFLVPITQMALSGSVYTTVALTVSFKNYSDLSLGHLFCTLISENQGLQKLRSISNLRKISGPAHLSFFSTPDFFFSLSLEVFSTNLKKIQLTNWKKIQVYWKKNAGVQDLKFF